jgi:hypothetical protein
MRYTDRYQNPPGNRARMVDHLAKQYERLGYNFVPLVTEQIRLFCGISVLFLRPSMPGDVMLSGDLDNRLKTLFDALRMPSCKEELRGYDEPTEMSACSIA